MMREFLCRFLPLSSCLVFSILCLSISQGRLLIMFEQNSMFVHRIIYGWRMVLISCSFRNGIVFTRFVCTLQESEFREFVLGLRRVESKALHYYHESFVPSLTHTSFFGWWISNTQIYVAKFGRHSHSLSLNLGVLPGRKESNRELVCIA